MSVSHRCRCRQVSLLKSTFYLMNFFCFISFIASKKTKTNNDSNTKVRFPGSATRSDKDFLAKFAKKVCLTSQISTLMPIAHTCMYSIGRYGTLTRFAFGKNVCRMLDKNSWSYPQRVARRSRVTRVTRVTLEEGQERIYRDEHGRMWPRTCWDTSGHHKEIESVPPSWP